MKSRLMFMTVLTFLAATVIPVPISAQAPAKTKKQPNYLVFNLGTLGGTSSGASAINSRGWAMGLANLPGDTTAHATLWIYGRMFDLGTLGGPNSAIAWPVHNDKGLIACIAE